MTTPPDHIGDLCANDREALLALVDAALAAGYALSANTEDDEGAWTTPTTDRAIILAALGVCDEELLAVCKRPAEPGGKHRRIGIVSLVYDYGNCPCELYQDYHESLESLIDPICRRLDPETYA